MRNDYGVRPKPAAGSKKAPSVKKTHRGATNSGCGTAPKGAGPRKMGKVKL